MAWSLGLLELGAVGAGPDCLVPSGLEGPAAFGMLAGEDARLLLAEVTGAGGRFQEVGEGHGGILRRSVFGTSRKLDRLYFSVEVIPASYENFAIFCFRNSAFKDM